VPDRVREPCARAAIRIIDVTNGEY
jgi:hypothetical protein